jgi:hypothetical protein
MTARNREFRHSTEIFFGRGFSDGSRCFSPAGPPASETAALFVCRPGSSKSAGGAEGRSKLNTAYFILPLDGIFPEGPPPRRWKNITSRATVHYYGKCPKRFPSSFVIPFRQHRVSHSGHLWIAFYPYGLGQVAARLSRHLRPAVRSE